METDEKKKKVAHSAAEMNVKNQRQDTASSCHAAATDGYREKTMRIACVEASKQFEV